METYIEAVRTLSLHWERVAFERRVTVLCNPRLVQRSAECSQERRNFGVAHRR
jgi:hypothetical protein